MSAAHKRRPAAPKNPVALSASVEDYLKAIYSLAGARGAAATNDIADRLNLTPASVTGMVRRLAELGLLSYERYRGVRLTQPGRAAALRTVRRHRVIEAYLSKALGYNWDSVHEEAERLEHAASDELIDRMAAAIGEPGEDPHGAPIPSREGDVEERKSMSLADAEPGYSGNVVSVTDEDPELLRYLAKLSIVPGKRLAVRTKEPFDGPIRIVAGKHQSSIGHTLASQVLVSRSSGPREK